MGFFDVLGTPLRAVGSVVGGIGTGLADGAPKNNYRGSQYQFDKSDFGDYTKTNQQIANGRNSDFMQALHARAMGTGGPSSAELQLQRGGDQNLQQALAMASQRSNGNVGMQQRNAQNALGQVNADTNQQAAILRAQEQAQAVEQYQQAQQYYTNLGFTAEQARAQALMDYHRLQAGEQGRVEGLNAGVMTKNAEIGSEFSGNIIKGGSDAGAKIATSDKRAKKNIEKNPKEVSEFLDALTSYAYEYKDKKSDGEGRHFSPMAQDLEKTSLGKAMVFEEGGKKRVDYARGFGAILAAQAELNKRLKQVEGRKA